MTAASTHARSPPLKSNSYTGWDAERPSNHAQRGGKMSENVKFPISNDKSISKFKFNPPRYSYRYF